MPTPPPLNIPAPEPWRTLLAEWARSLRADNKSPNTIKCYVDVARKFHVWCHEPIAPPDTEDAAAWLADVPAPPAEPADVTKRHVQSWIIYRLATTSPGNANNNYRSLQPWFAWLLDEGEIDANPMDGMKPPSVPEQPVPIVPDDLLRKVLDQCAGRDLLSRRDEAIIRLIWDTGARLSEVANLTLDDLDLNVDVIRVIGKGSKPRAIPFSPKTGKALSRYLRVRARESRASEPWLWLADRNKGRLGANGIKIMIRRRGEAAGANEVLGRNLHAHLGRHTVAHQWQAQGGNVTDLMMVMGWSTSQMAQRYGKSAATERAHEAARKLRIGDRL